ncbi:putative secreted protein [Diplodia seriata]|uniref:Putative secreted protein n=1 Tax=Diplodia seriata TaxID=420778 RepID=A0A0G2G7Y3_9PEZI|nr:putative secreted protein [Diplodia seriata]
MSFKMLVSLALASLSVGVCSAKEDNAFSSPDLKYRPKFRYWIPDASVSNEIVQKDIATMADVGAGGFELVAYYQYGFPESDSGEATPTDWGVYGFGTDAFRKTFHAALEATDEHGLLMDFGLGANQGQGCPAEAGSSGLAVELAYSNVTVASGESYNGTLPLTRQPDNLLGSIMHMLEDWGQQNLSAVVAVEIKDVQTSPTTYPTNVVGRIIDLTSSVNADRSLSWTAPAGNSTWKVMAWYERFTNQKSQSPGLNATNFIQNGSWVVDHFSAAGSKKMTDFFDEHVIPDDESRKLLAAVGQHGWEDSMEMMTSLFWTPSFQQMFQEGRGYSVTQCLPFLITTQNYWIQAIAPYGEIFTSSNESLANSCNEDYRTTLNEGYQQYLSQYVEWAHSRGIEYSAQPAYNLPLNMLDDISILDAPEGESLGFENVIDSYRQMSGPAHLAGNNYVSSECGALSGSPFSQTANDLLWSVRRGLATGISMNILHGFAYSGPYVNTTWPSYTTFTYRYTEMWNQNQPMWRHMNDTIMYIARNQYVSQIGTPKVDLAFYSYSAPWHATVKYQNDNLENLGYTYGYLGPGSLQSEDAVIGDDGVLAPSGPAYKALIFSNETSLTPEAATKLKEFASSGLPIFFVGTSNFTSIGRKSGDAANVTSTMNAILSSSGGNIHAVASASELPAALAAASITPRAAFPTAMADMYTFWRQTADTDYVYIYNDGSETQTAAMAFNASGTPYVLDAWTGAIAPILHYTRTNTTHTTILITLAANQTTIIAFTNSDNTAFPAAPSVHVQSTTGAGLTGLRYNGTAILAQLRSDASLTLSDGSSVNLTTTAAAAAAASNLTSWSIVVDDWHRTNDTYSMDTAVTPHAYANASLAPWKDLDSTALTGVGGIGTYTTTFASPGTAGLGALLHLGPIANTVRVWLNGAMLPPVDITDAVVDVTGFVRTGRNEVKIEVASTLFNRIKADGNGTYTAGVTANEENSRYYEVNEYKDFGLLGPVWVEWVEEKVVR